MVGSKYWSLYRANALYEDDATPRPIADALGEIEHAIREVFPAASTVTARKEVSDVFVTFLPGQKPMSVRFSNGALGIYRRSAEASRQEALKTLRLVCTYAFAREYTPDHDPVNPFVIDAQMALSDTTT